jgi:hypothetical protein
MKKIAVLALLLPITLPCVSKDPLFSTGHTGIDLLIAAQASSVLSKTFSSLPAIERTNHYLGENNGRAITTACAGLLLLGANNQGYASQLPAPQIGAALLAQAALDNSGYDTLARYVPFVGTTLQSDQAKELVRTILTFVIYNNIGPKN